MRPFQRELRPRQVPIAAPPADPVARQSDLSGVTGDITALTAAVTALADATQGGFVALDARLDTDESAITAAQADADAAQAAANAAQSDVDSLPASVWPIGSVFISVVSTNPATLLGFGTWVAFGAGRVLVGLDSGDTDFDTELETGGNKTNSPSGTLSAPELTGSTAAEASHTHSVTSNVTVADHAAHTHSVTAAGTNSAPAFTGNAVAAATTAGSPRLVTANASGVTVVTTATGSVAAPTFTGSSVTSGNPSATLSHTPTNNAVTSAAGSSHSHGIGSLAATAPDFTGDSMSIVQPYVVVRFWRRTA